MRREEGFEEEAPGVINEEERRIDDGKEGESTRYANHMRMTDTMRGSMGDPLAATVSQR